MVRKFLVAFSCIVLLAVSSSQRLKYRCSADTSKPIYTTNPLSPSVAAGFMIFQYGWIDYFNDTKFMNLAQALGESYFRIGGSKGDVTTFDPTPELSSEKHSSQCNGQTRNETRFRKHLLWADAMEQAEEKQQILHGNAKTFKPMILKTSQWRQLNEFCQCVGWKLVFGLNLEKRDGLVWNSTNAEQLLNYTENKYKVNWELGNEPNWYYTQNLTILTADQVAEGFCRLRELLDASTWWRDAKLLGPDNNNVGTKRALQYVTTFLRGAHQAIDGVTFHFYYLNGHTAVEDDFLSPDTLAKISDISSEIQLTRQMAPGRQVWLGETASAYSNGAPGLSNSYLDGFTWLDKLGMTSKMGVDVVVRQTFFGGSYGLLNETFDPMPDYWLTLLYKKLVGSQVLNVTMQQCTATKCIDYEQKYVRIYAHCTKTSFRKQGEIVTCKHGRPVFKFLEYIMCKILEDAAQHFKSIHRSSGYPIGSVVFYFLNLSPSSEVVSFDVPAVGLQSADLYLLQPTGGNLTSTEVNLNGKPLRLGENFSIPDLIPRSLNPWWLQTGLQIPSRTYGYLVIGNMKATACYTK